jgi:O-antigen/teichoic acid export membrane protein
MSPSSPHRDLSKRDILWGFAAQGLNIGTMVIMLPVIMRYMSRAEVGIWFVFFAILGLVQLLELGFQYVLARSFSYVYAGAQKLLSDGLEANQGPFKPELLAELLAASRRIYLCISGLASLALGIGGTAYLYAVMPKSLDSTVVFWSWAAVSAGYIINFYYGYLNAFLQGRGDMMKSNQVVVATKLTQLTSSLALVAFCHAGLIGLGIGSLLSTLVNRYLAYHFAFPPRMRETIPSNIPNTAVNGMVKTLWHNASRYGIALIGAFLISRANIIIAASRIGVEETAGYSLALQIFMVIQIVATLPFNLQLPKLSALRAIENRADISRTFSTALATAILLFSFAAMFVLLGGNPLLHLIRSSTALPGTALLAVMALTALLETNHGICANFIATGNQIPFAWAGLMTGICIALIGWFVAPRFGTYGLVITVCVCQLAYNNWKWPLVAARTLKTNYLYILTAGIKNSVETFSRMVRI